MPDSREYVQPTMQADRGRLHLEARYNYEDLDTGEGADSLLYTWSELTLAPVDWFRAGWASR